MAKNKFQLTLSELIKDTSAQIRQARDEAPKDTVMQFERCELELAVSLVNDGSGKIKFLVFSAGLGAKEGTISKVKLSFGPIAGKDTVAFVGTPNTGKGEPRKKTKG